MYENTSVQEHECAGTRVCEKIKFVGKTSLGEKRVYKNTSEREHKCMRTQVYENTSAHDLY